MAPKRSSTALNSASGGGKQQNIAKFFGGKTNADSVNTPKIGAQASTSGSTGVQKKTAVASLQTSRPVAEVASATFSGREAVHAQPQLKRLRKAGTVTQTAATDAEDLADRSPSPSPRQENTTPAKSKSPAKRKSRTPAAGSPEETKATSAHPPSPAGRRPQMATSPAATDLTGSSADDEGQADRDDEAASNKRRKKAVLKAPASTAKVAGVGKSALAAAELHAKYEAGQAATWEAGAPVPFAFLAQTFTAIDATTKRTEITNILTDALRTIIATTPDDLLPTAYLLNNRVAPAHAGVELGIGDAILIKAISSVTGRNEKSIKEEAAKSGDLSSIANAAKGKQGLIGKVTANTIRSVFKTFRDIAKIEGNKSQDHKKALISKLLTASGKGSNEAGYIIRLLQGKLRIGLQEQGLLVGLAQAAFLERESAGRDTSSLAPRLEAAAQTVKQVFSECPSLDELVPALLGGPIKDLPKSVRFKPGVPIKAMLAKPTNGVTEVLDKFQDTQFTVEYKYDGERAQVHVDERGHVTIYSRNSEDMTGKYPDLAQRMPDLLAPDVKSLVVDCEAVAWDPKEGKIRPFQVLSTRKRKDVTVGSIQVQVVLFAFDCLFLNGESLLSKPLTERREALVGSMTAKPGQMEFATFKTSHDVEELGNFLNESVAAGMEGLIVKSLDSTYEPSKRSVNWLKLKKDYLEGVGDTFDVVVIGAWHGRGKRTGVYGSYLLAIYDDENEQFQTISKIGTGFSEELLKTLHGQLNEHVIDAPRTYYRWGESLVPEVWFDAQVVWEVKAADLSISPLHKAAAGLVDPTKGISIRFPRLVKTREDKSPDQATSPEQVAEMYNKQVLLSKTKGKAADDDDD
ncbi:hypothetical protein WJX73_009727 [Symbiochloris irregularis]|uniref:DNA ligase n=1 Tax=Symbiochloris irregularis TaxID=706552 RepID=A0AAW1PJZ2_9CHLO